MQKARTATLASDERADVAPDPEDGGCAICDDPNCYRNQPLTEETAADAAHWGFVVHSLLGDDAVCDACVAQCAEYDDCRRMGMLQDLYRGESDLCCEQCGAPCSS